MVLTLLSRPKTIVAQVGLDLEELNRISKQHYGKKFNELCSDRKIIIKKLFMTGV